MGVLTLLVFVDKPAEARWLTDHEKQLVIADLKTDEQKQVSASMGLAKH